MAYIFDGKSFAARLEAKLKARVEELKRRLGTPTLVAILAGDDAASRIYLNLKQKAAERVGITLHLIKLKDVKKEQLLQLIKEANENPKVQGVMIQLPLPGELNSKVVRQEILDTIDARKDVDGLRTNSLFLPAAVKAVLYATKEAQQVGCLAEWKAITACVVGARGVIGGGIVHELKKLGVEVLECDVADSLKQKTLRADLLVSATGVPGLIKGDMVKEGVVAVDVGAPKGDVEFESVSPKASFVTPVPGGIGPVTVSCLLENLLDALWR